MTIKPNLDNGTLCFYRDSNVYPLHPDSFLDRLRELDVPAVHLGVSKRNPRAVRFYEREGFHVIEEFEWAFDMGIQL